MNKIDMQVNPNNGIGAMINTEYATSGYLSTGSTTTAGGYTITTSTNPVNFLNPEIDKLRVEVIELRIQIADTKRYMAALVEVMDGYLEKEQELKDIRDFLNK